MNELFVSLDESKYIKINKTFLKGLISKGDIVGMVSNSSTDDYVYDAENNYGKTDWMPVILTDGDTFGTVTKDGKLSIGVNVFSDKYVRANTYEDQPTTISLSLHSFKTLLLKDTKGTHFYTMPDMSDHEKLTSAQTFVLAVIYGVSSSYRKQYFNKVKDFDTIFASLIEKNYISKSGAMTATGKAYIYSLTRDEQKANNEYGRSLGFDYYKLTV